MYCSPEEVLTALQARGLDDPGEGARGRAAQIASALIDAYCGRHFRAEATEELHYPEDGVLYTNHRPVYQVEWVKDAAGEEVVWELLSARAGKLRVVASSPVVVRYYYNDPNDPVPEEVRLACAELAANVLQAPPEFLRRLSDGGLSAETSGVLTPSLKSVLDKHRRVSIR